MDEELEFVVDQRAANERLDKYLAAENSDLSRTYLQRLIESGQVTVNEEEKKSSYQLQVNDRIKLDIPQPEEIEVEPEPIPLDIIAEDEDIVVVNKQPNLVVHPAPGHPNGTLVNGLLFHCDNLSGINGKIRPGIVHRLDQDTSGVLVAAKNNEAHRSLVNQFKERKTEKIYLTLVEGNVQYNRGKIDAAIGRDPKDRKKMTVTEYNSKKAVTRFKVLERFGDYTWLQVKLETGRTHQIRVHMEYLGNPVVGDETYGYNKQRLNVNRQLLHAHKLSFIHPLSQERVKYEAKLPADISEVLNNLQSEKR
ncbi:MAG: RluA family pseudouridine synthase [Bacillota bacterium]